MIRQSASIAAYRVRQAELATVAAGKVCPVVLTPTRAQQAAGVTVLDARDDQMPAAARRLRDELLAAGVAVRVTYAHALAPPATSRTQDWSDRFSVAVRVRRGEQRGWACWVNGSFDSAQWRERPGMFARNVGAKEFAVLAVGGDWAAPVLPAPVVCAVPGCGKTVRVKLSGGLYAHRCGEAAQAKPGKQRALTH